jgi:succinoglycan biosynthesis transport protein ExoP
MQPTETLSVSRRALDVEDYIDIARRHKGWIFGPFLFCLVASVVGVYLWPDSYVSQAVIMIKPQQIPESMVQSSVNQQMFDRLNSMEQEIRSRAVLTTIINTYDLYKRERARMPIEDVIDQMNKNVVVSLVGQPNTNTRTVPAFAVQFTYSDRYVAQRVVSDLVSRFTEISQRNRTNQTFMTTQFMQDELATAKKELDSVENRLTEFEMKNNGRLPDQAQGMMQAVQTLTAQTAALDTAMSRANQDKLQLESNLRIVRDRQAELNRQPAPEQSAAAVERNERLNEVDRDIDAQQDMLRVMRQRYSDAYPDVQAAQLRLEALRQKRSDIVKESDTKKQEDAKKVDKTPAAPRPDPPALAAEKRDLDTRAKQLQAAIEAKDVELEDYAKQMKRASDGIKNYQARIEQVPIGDQEYTGLLRDRDMAKQRYVQAQEKVDRAQVSQEMENRKQGEMLELLDPASLPSTPTEPKRYVVIPVGAAIGLLLGFVIAGGREMKDTSLKNLKDVRAYTQMAILGSIPLLENDFVVRRRKRLAWLGWTTACLAAVVIMSGSIVYYYVSKT